MSSNNNFRGRGKFFWRGRGNFRGRGFYHNNKQKINDKSDSDIIKGTPENVQPMANTSRQSSSRRKPTQIAVEAFYNHVSGEYKAWRLYHPLEEYDPASPTVKKVKAMEKFIKKHKQLFDISEIEDRKSFYVDLKHLTEDDGFISDWVDFQLDLRNSPDSTLNCLSLAMHQFILNELANQITKAGGKSTDLSLPIIRVRILNFEPVVQLKDLAANTYGKLVSIKGTVIRVGNIKLFCTWLAFSCNKCNNIQCVQQLDGSYTLPTSCTAPSCMSRTFTPLCSSNYTQTINWQAVKIQEIITDDQGDGGRVPRTIECELFEDLVDVCLPGDVITVTGIVKIHSSDDGYSKKSKSPSIFSIYIEVKSIFNNKSYSGSGGNTNKTIDIEFSTEDYYNIREIHSRSNLFKLMVNSLCPAIYGHEMVKAGLLLGLIGGLQSGPSRGDSHILIVGDPGLGKSQMLQACATLAPRGVYVCGNTSSATGLTVTLTREAGGNFALEAGALVLADQGCCCIDEFDKMSTQHQALLEAMEQQVISISKAGIICTLPARTSILAAANPVCGHYNRAKTVAENLRMGSALLSRFDLVFILQDQPNEHLDSLLSEHVMALYSGLKQSTTDLNSTEGSSFGDLNIDYETASLCDKLRLNPAENLELISSTSLRKYIAYAKKYVPNPQLSSGAAQVLQTFYLELRRQHHTLDATPITTRQLESLIRLTQARAKLELREEATVFDAMDVVELMRWSMVDTFSDNFGGLDFQRSQNGSGMSTKSKAKQFISALHRQADVQGRSIFSVSDMKDLAQKSNIIVGDFFSFISSLNDQGFLLKKGKNLYQLLSVDY